MNFFYHSVYGLFAIHLIFISVHGVVNSNDVQSQNLLRSKRVYKGSDVKDDQFLFVVFIRTLLNNKTSYSSATLDCMEKICTGTLIHPRFALTLLSCVVNPQKQVKVSPENVQIFLKTRPYAEIKDNTTYKIGQQIISKPYENNINLDSDNVALILMNDTFPEVKTFPRIMSVDPVAEGTILSCSTVGYSFIGRNLSRPIAEKIAPRTYNLEVMFNVTECSDAKYKPYNHPAYMCYAGLTAIEHSLCEQGDEGSPLLCKRPPKRKSAVKKKRPPMPALPPPPPPPSPPPSSSSAALAYALRPRKQAPAQTNSTKPGSADTYDGLFVYGLANVVPKCSGRQVKLPKWTKTSQVLFLYMLMYGPWVIDEMEDYDDEANGTTSTRHNSTAATVKDTTTVTVQKLSTVTRLPAYYDTNDYDAAEKNLMRCKDGDGGPSVAVFHPSVGGGHWAARSRGADARPAVVRWKRLVAFLCAAAVAAAV